MTTQSGDLVIDRLPKTTQILASLCYRGMSATTQQASDDWKRLFDAFILGKRQEQLLAKLDHVLRQADNVVLPWSIEHLDGLSDLLVAQGYRETARSDIFYAGSVDLGKLKSFDEIFQKFTEDSVRRIPNCQVR